MRKSPEARDALLRFYQAFTEAGPGDMERYDRVSTRDEDLLVVGSAFHE